MHEQQVRYSRSYGRQTSRPHELWSRRQRRPHCSPPPLDLPSPLSAYAVPPSLIEHPSHHMPVPVAHGASSLLSSHPYRIP